MKSSVQTQYGAPQVLEILETATPTPGPSEVLIRIHAAPVTQGDRRLRAADFPGASAIFGRLIFGVFTPRNPTGGTMFAGQIVAIGSEVTRFAVGDDVFGSCDKGAYAEFIAVPEDGHVAAIPAGIDYDVAAAAPYGAVTALGFLRDIAKLQAGERVLVIGASGGVGRYAVQIARHMGAEVTGVCSERHADLVRELGASEVIDYARTDYSTQGKTYDVIFDTTSGDDFRKARTCLSEAGRYLTVYMTLKVVAQMLWTKLRGGPKALPGVVMGTPEQIRDVAQLLAEGAIRPRIASRFPFSQIVEAHQQLEGANPGGEVIVTIHDQARAGSQPRGVAAA